MAGELLLWRGSGFAIMSPTNFPDWRAKISGRMKLKQILEAFREVMDPGVRKYVCAPCSNCKGMIRDLLSQDSLESVITFATGGWLTLWSMR